MNKIFFISCVSTLLYSQPTLAEYRAEFTTKTVSVPATIYVPRTAPLNTLLYTADLGTFTPWVWWNVTGTTEVGIYLPQMSGNEIKIPGGGFVKEINSSGVGFALYGSVNTPCSASAYADGVNTKDGNISNRLICSSNQSSAHYSVTLKAAFYKIGNNVKTQTLPSTRAAMLILYNNGFITSDSYGNIEPNVWMGPINVVSSGCDVKNKTINVPFGKVNKSTFAGVGSTSPDSKQNFNIELDCDPISPIKITFVGTADASQTPGTIALNNPDDVNSASGYGIQVKYNNQPIKLNQLMPIVQSNNSGQYSIPLEAAYIQTASGTKAGKANGTLQFNMQYH
ncbi:adhesin [Providencia heimbachae]|uniref:fimbrial protein n=1 Tax=Providencia heimbachae TaxID=333962 RepID=UPI0010BEC1E6|nr:fimbrial protein [Providencia heimbachae]QCJ70248.1 adhesin [Providencia heimbachae]